MEEVPAARRELVAALEASGAVRSAAVRDAFLAVPREAFLPELAADAGLRAVYANDAIRAKADARGRWISSSSQPSVMAEMLEALELAPGQRVLEIGTGTGYNAALLARLVAPGGSVLSVELEPELAARAARALRRLGAAVDVRTGDGRRALPDAAPFDRIVATVAAGDVPRAWRDQLRAGGLLLLPLELGENTFPQAIVSLRRDGELLRSVRVLAGGFMSLRGAPGDPAPEDPTLAANDLGGRPFAALSGHALARLPRGARRRLLAALLVASRRRPLPFRAGGREAFSLHAYVALSAGLTAAAQRIRTFGTAVLAPDGAGVALLRTRLNGGTWIEGYGAEGPERELLDLVHRWDAGGRPGVERLRVTVGFAGSPPVEGQRRGESTVAVEVAWE